MALSNKNYIELVSEKLKTLPLIKQQEVLDFVEFLAQKAIENKSQEKRVPNLQQGKLWMNDDFNEPLSNNFWSGES